MISINIKDVAGTFAENKDIAQNLRVNTLMPALEKGEAVILDFGNVKGATQSFVHSLISEPFRKYGSKTLDLIQFKDCNEFIKQIITIVTEYMQEAE
ncbi:STAS-like domain-containing protein [Candidatus Kaiserbacteria bacterium]|nr:STAS-like domain-containing protein [Candidatus Kaiserbacteria bacterium]